MQRTKKNETPFAILIADIHLREDTPICRTDNFYATQWEKLDWLSALQKKHNCIIIHSGDLLHHWKPSPELLADIIEHLPKNFYTIIGNHDLPQHSMELLHKSGINPLEKAGCLKILNSGHWGNKNPKPIFFSKINRNILVWHIMTYQGKPPYPGCTAPKSSKILRKFKSDLIVTGDNHKTFVEYHKDRVLVNPGSMMRQTADQEDHKPCVFLYYAKTNTVKQVFIPINTNVISKEHLLIQKQKNKQINAFIAKLQTDWEAAFSFEDNLKIFKEKNNVKKGIMQIIYKAMEEE